PKKQVRFNNNGLPVGPSSTQFVTFIGKMARMYCAPTYAYWPIVPDDIKKHIFKRVTESVYTIISLLPCLNAMPIPCATAHSSTDEPLLAAITLPVSLRSAAAHPPIDPFLSYFIFSCFILKDVYDLLPTRRVGVLLKANISWKYWKHRLRKVYDRYSTNSERMKNIPKRTKKEDWESFIEICSTDEEKIKREKGKLSREHMKLPHTSGRLGCARIEEELIKENPDGTVTRTHVFVATHTSKDRSCLSLALRPTLRLVSLDPYLGEKDLDNDPVAKVIGRDGKGRVRGLGTGVTKTVVHASAPYIKIVEEEKRKHESTDENVKLVMQRLDEQTRARKILEKKLEGYALVFENTSPQEISQA
ncbi:hypothetical protein IFM89_032653, partial [Coptis chinensis]